MKKAYESRTFQSAVVFNVIAVLVAGLLEVLPELANYEESLFNILMVVIVAVMGRFGLPGIINEVQKARKE